MLNPQFKTRWLAALRSGTYVQGRKYLRSIDSSGKGYLHCCLGVGCDLFDPSRWEDTRTYAADSQDGEPCRSGEEIPFPIAYQIGLTPMDQDTLIRMNDTDREPFSEIADWIERNL